MCVCGWGGGGGWAGPPFHPHPRPEPGRVDLPKRMCSEMREPSRWDLIGGTGRPGWLPPASLAGLAPPPFPVRERGLPIPLAPVSSSSSVPGHVFLLDDSAEII